MAADAAYVAGGPAGVESAAQAEILAFILANEISSASAVIVLQNLQAGAGSGSPLFTVIDNELAVLNTDPATLDNTVATGTAAQIRNQAALVASLLQTNPSAANQILADLTGRISSPIVFLSAAMGLRCPRQNCPLSS